MAKRITGALPSDTALDNAMRQAKRTKKTAKPLTLKEQLIALAKKEARDKKIAERKALEENTKKKEDEVMFSGNLDGFKAKLEHEKESKK